MKKKLWLAISGLCLMLGLVVLVVCLQTAKTKAEAAAGDAVSADITVVKYRSVAGIMQYRRWNETKGIWVDEEWVDFTETPKPTLTAEETGKVPTPTPMPTPKPTPTWSLTYGWQAELEKEFVEITAGNFGNPFYLYLQENFDTDGDGMLSVAEREAVTEIDFVAENYFDLPEDGEKGLNARNAKVSGFYYFPNVEKIRVDFASRIYISDLSKLNCFELRAEDANGKRNSFITNEGVTEISISDCPALQEIRCQNYLDGELTAYNCKSLKTYTEEEGCMARVYFGQETQNLSLYVMERADGTRQETDISHGEQVRVLRRFGGQDGFEMLDLKASAPTKAPAALPEQMPEQKVVPADMSVDKVPVDAAHFSDGIFRAYLLKTYDTDKDGYLSKAEREKLTGLYDDDYYDNDAGSPFAKYARFLGEVRTFDGLDWFPNLDSISVLGSCADVFLKNHPSIRYVGNAEGGMNIWAENCDKLESMGFCESHDGTVFVKDCKNFKRFSASDSDFSALYFSGTPLLVISENRDNEGTVGFGKEEFRLDANAGIRIRAKQMENQNGTTTFENYGRKTSIEWLGDTSRITDFANDLEKMKVLNAACITQSEVYSIRVYQDDSENGQKIRSVYFSRLGDTTEKLNQWNKPKTVLRMAVAYENIPLYKENFSLEPIADEVQIEPRLLSVNGKSVIFVSSAANVYYMVDGKKINVGKVWSEHYFVREADGSLSVYDSEEDIEAGKPTSLLTQIPESKVVKADASVDKVPIDAAHFSDEKFRAFLSGNYDADGDGFLSTEERENMLTLDWERQITRNYVQESDNGTAAVLDGLDWFPRLEMLDLWDSNTEVYLIDHPSVREVNVCEATALIWAQNCEKFVSLGSSYASVRILAQDCKNLTSVGRGDDGSIFLVALGTTPQTETIRLIDADDATDEDYGPVGERIPIDEAHFGAAAFCNYLKSYDEDKDGQLSERERNKVRKIYFHGTGSLEGVSVSDEIKGLEYFKYLSEFSTSSNLSVTIKKNLYLWSVHIYGEGTPSGKIVIEDCPRLKEVECPDYQGEIFVKNCILLQSYQGSTEKATFLYTPNVIFNRTENER